MSPTRQAGAQRSKPLRKDVAMVLLLARSCFFKLGGPAAFHAPVIAAEFVFLEVDVGSQASARKNDSDV